MDEQPFSDAGMIVFGVGIVSMALIVLVAMIAGYIFGGRHRILSGCGVGCAGLLVGGVGTVVLTAIAMAV